MRRARARLFACLLLVLVTLAACAADDVGSDEGAQPGEPENIGTVAQPMTVDEIMARADEWVQKQVPYCGGVRGGTDYICGGTCQRPAAAWDKYRTDCSGFVSWCWQIASVPTTRTYMHDVTGSNGWHTIPIDELKAGDAVVCDGHIKLFSKFVGSGSAEIYEEYNCGKVARKAVQSFTRSGNTMRFGYDSRVYHPIRRNGLTAPPPDGVKGVLDKAERAIEGWAVDLGAKNTALAVDAWFDGEPGKGFRVQAKASLPRPDVAKALGVGPDHGYSIATPLFLCDAEPHTVTVTAKPADGGGSVVVSAAGKSFKCPIPGPRAGVLRHVVNPSSFGAWRFDRQRSLRWTTAEARAAYVQAPPLPVVPHAGKADDGEVYVVDGASRRKVAEASRAAWGLGGEVPPLAPIEALLPAGLPLPVRPILVQAVGAPEVYLLDTDPANPVDPGAEPDDADAERGAGDELDDAMTPFGRRRGLFDEDAGCAQARAPRAGGAGAAALVGIVAALAAARRRRTRGGAGSGAPAPRR